MRITDNWLKANYRKYRPKPLELADRDGLSVRASTTGKISFVVRFRYDGSRNTKRVVIGSYPRMPLQSARAETDRLRGRLEQGHDPRIVRKLEKQAIAKAPSYETLFRLWYERYCTKNKEGHHEILRSFELHVFPKIGALPADKVTLHQWLDVLEKQADERPGICDRLLTNAKQMQKWCVKRKLLPTNVLVDIYAQEDFQLDDEEKEARVLSDEEIRHLWLALERSRMALKNKIFLKLCLFFGCRNGELRRARKVDFDFTNMVWTVPREHNKIRKKGGKPILRPIIPEVVPLLEQAFSLSLRSEYAFTNADSDVPMGKRVPLALPYNLMQWLRSNLKYEMIHWSAHSLRKTARTNFSTLTNQPHIAEIMLGHKLPKNWRIYDAHTYLEEQAVVYTAWWQRLLSITASVPAAASPREVGRARDRIRYQDLPELQPLQALIDAGLGVDSADGAGSSGASRMQ
jgi:integrase